MKVHSDTDCVVVDAKVARLEGELADARRHWKRCEQGWNKVILQAEGFQRAIAAKDAALRAWAEDIACPECVNGTVADYGSGEVVECGHCEGSNIDWPRFFAALSDVQTGTAGEGWPRFAAKDAAAKIVSILKANGMNLGVVQVPPVIQDTDRLYALKDAVAAFDAALTDAGEGTRPQFICNCYCHYTSEACCPECTSRRGEDWLPPEAKVLLKDISEAWLGAATPQELWDKFDDLWGRIAQFIAPTSLKRLEVK